MNKKMHVAVAGNIGSGKTTLAERLVKHYGWKAEFEDVDYNPYLPDFYSDMLKWSFHIQIYFLNSRFKQIMNIKTAKVSVIQDRTIYEDAEVFAKNLNATGLLNDRDYSTYLDLYNNMMAHIRHPDLLIYLRADIPILVGRIEQRGRAYENLIRLDYLRDLNKLYESWISSYDLGKLLIVDTNKINFDSNFEDLAHVINLVESEIHGLFS
jgi:deoxyadenosine/deoxycytidine kinase